MVQDRSDKMRNIAWFAITLAIAVYVFAMRMGEIGVIGILDADYYWHAALGKYITEHKSIFDTDIFSWYAAEMGYKETAHSWLGSVIVYLFSCITKRQLLNAALFTSVTSAITCFLMVKHYGFPFDRNNEKYDMMNCLFAIFAGAATLRMIALPRPLNFGIIFFVMEMILLHDGFENASSKKCWLMPLLAVVWANIHGGSIPMLFAFMGLFVALSFLPSFSWRGIGQKTQRTKQRITRFVLLFVSDVAAAMLNPYGWKLFIYSFFTNDSATKKNVGEWQRVFLSDPTIAVVLILLFALVFFRKQTRTIELRYILPVVATLFMTGKYVRIEPYLILTTVMLLWHWIKETYGDTERGIKNLISIREMAGLVLGCAIFIGAFSVLTMTDAVTHDGRSEDPVSEELIQQLDSLQPKRLFTEYDTGGHLIYHGYQTFIDSRADLFPGDMLNRAMDFTDLKGFSAKDAEEYVEEYGFDAALISNAEQLTVWLDMREDWERIYTDDYFALFRKLPVQG